MVRGKKFIQMEIHTPVNFTKENDMVSVSLSGSAVASHLQETGRRTICMEMESSRGQMAAYTRGIMQGTSGKGKVQSHIKMEEKKKESGKMINVKVFFFILLQMVFASLRLGLMEKPRMTMNASIN